MNLKGIMLSEVSQTEKDQYWRYHLHVAPNKYNKLWILTEKQRIHRYGEQTSGHHWQGGTHGTAGVGSTSYWA